MEKRKVSVITAHPDDAELMFGGTIAKYTRNGHEVEIIVVTSGESWNKIGNTNLEEVRKIRKKEAMNSAKVLGVKNIHFLNLKDGRLNRYELMPLLLEEIRKINPNYILTHSPKEGHYDHKEISYSIKRLCNIDGEPAPIINPYLESKYDAVNSFKGLYTSNPIKTGINSNTVYLSLEKEDVERKIEAVLCHKSQFQDREGMTDKIMTEARFWGNYSNQEYSELLMGIGSISSNKIDFLIDNF
ncbi:MAG: PIG-L family deacetylase [Candidatus Dojkabacteria bacterium]|jgi:LmbE family N-acetylglucosaminyl deacetylase|nr:PIG-L family deacetylase [Candidatus Dojkabacteria bacterium]